jgi:enoyl-[acyl-carrier protein] reductase II
MGLSASEAVMLTMLPPDFCASKFPDASTRGLRNGIAREWERRDDPPPYKVVPDSELPVIGQARLYGQEFPMKRFCGFPPTPEFTGDFEEMSLLEGFRATR